VVLPQWNADWNGHVGLCQLLARFGVNALRLSLPYHDRRMPPELSRADYIVSSNLGQTLHVCRQAVVDARRAVAWLEREGFERIGILGTSLGSCLAMLTTAHEPRIRAQALNHVSLYFADVIWEGLSTEHVRRGLDGHVALDRLREWWMPISPAAYVRRVKGTPTLRVSARYDTTFPLHLSMALVEACRREGVDFELTLLPCGHYTTGLAPFKYLDGWALVKFLRKRLETEKGLQVGKQAAEGLVHHRGQLPHQRGDVALVHRVGDRDGIGEHQPDGGDRQQGRHDGDRAEQAEAHAGQAHLS